MNKLSCALILLFLTSCGQELVIDRDTIFAGTIFRPDASKIDDSGVTYKPHSKGFLYNSPSRRIVFTCSHSNPRAGTKIGFVDANRKLHEATIEKVYKIEVDMWNRVPMQPASYDNFLNSDLSICVLQEPAPEFAKAYDLASTIKDGDWMVTMHKDKSRQTATANVAKTNATMNRRNIKIFSLQGDSGLPWFTLDNKVVSHFTLVDMGYGPNYTHPYLRPTIDKTLKEAEEYAQSNGG